jgi:hypothetical protein
MSTICYGVLLTRSQAIDYMASRKNIIRNPSEPINNQYIIEIIKSIDGYDKHCVYENETLKDNIDYLFNEMDGLVESGVHHPLRITETSGECAERYNFIGAMNVMDSYTCAMRLDTLKLPEKITLECLKRGEKGHRKRHYEPITVTKTVEEWLTECGIDTRVYPCRFYLLPDSAKWCRVSL